MRKELTEVDEGEMQLIKKNKAVFDEFIDEVTRGGAFGRRLRD